MALVLVTAAAIEPIAVDEALRNYLRIDHSLDDGLLADLAVDAREDCELYTGRQLITATWRLTLDSFPSDGGIVIPHPPLISVVSIVYDEAIAGTATTLATTEYAVDTDSEPGWVVPSYSAGSWPDTRDQANAVRITYTAGYGSSRDDVPEGLRALMRAQIAAKYDNRAGPWPGLEMIHAGYRKYWHGCLTVNV